MLEWVTASGLRAGEKTNFAVVSNSEVMKGAAADAVVGPRAGSFISPGKPGVIIPQVDRKSI